MITAVTRHHMQTCKPLTCPDIFNFDVSCCTIFSYLAIQLNANTCSLMVFSSLVSFRAAGVVGVAENCILGAVSTTANIANKQKGVAHWQHNMPPTNGS